MITNETHGSDQQSGNQPHNIHNDVGATARRINYEQLIEFHFNRRALGKDGNERPKQSLDNERSIIDDWLAHHDLCPSNLVGEELGINFDRNLGNYASALNSRGLAEQTVRDRKTVANKLRESFIEYLQTDGLPKDFCGALVELIKASGMLIPEVACKSGIPCETLRNWTNGGFPNYKSLPRVRKLETVLNVSRGTLSSRLPSALWLKKPVQRCTTAWRRHQSVLRGLKYRLLILTALLQQEWEDLVLFFTDPQWAIEHGYERNSEWRIRWNNNRCVTAERVLNTLRGFFGYLCLPVTAPDKRVAGLGFRKEDLTLALLTDAKIVIKYLYFMKGRSVSDSFNSGTIHLLAVCTMLTRSGTGYLRQRPEFGANLPQPVSESDWPQWCEDNRLVLMEFWEEITKGKPGKRDKKNRVKVTRSSFEPVRDIIRTRQHPITALFDLADRLVSLTPLYEGGSTEFLAVHCRSIFHIRLLSSNPLRPENFSMMTYIPKDRDSYERACELYSQLRTEKRAPDLSRLYVETTDESNLYQSQDGSWRLRFDARDFKNEKGEDIEPGVLPTPYDVEVVPSARPALVEYIFRHRPVLNQSLMNTKRDVKAKRSLPALTRDEELAILHCPYVFRPSATAASLTKTDESSALYGVGQMSVRQMSSHILVLTSRYLPESKGFSAYACRHLVATEYIKNHPDGFEVAAVALHNTAATVRKHYSWVEVGDLIKPWSDYHEEIKRKHDRGEI